MSQLCAAMLAGKDRDMRIQLPPPAIYKVSHTSPKVFLDLSVPFWLSGNSSTGVSYIILAYTLCVAIIFSFFKKIILTYRCG